MKKYSWMVAICLCLMGTAAFADPQPKHRKGNPADQEALNLSAAFVQDSRMNADGNLSEWSEGGVKFQTLLAGEYDYDWTGPKDLSANVKAMYGVQKIYFVISVTDQAVVSKLRQWKSDKVELWLAPEDSKGKILAKPRGAEFDIGPMVDGGRAGVKWLSGKQGGLQAVGFVGGNGYDFEIAVDYSALSKQTPVFNGVMRYCVLVRDWDQDDGNEDEVVIGSCPIHPQKASSISPSNMGKIRLDLGDAIWTTIENNGALSSSRGEWTKQFYNIAGSELPELIGVSDNVVIMAGFDLGMPELSYYTIELQPSGNLDAPKLEIKDVNGDKKPEIILTREENCLNDNMTATRTYVFTFDRALSLLTNYMTEQRSADKSKFVRNSFKITKKGMVQTLEKGSAEGMAACQLNGDDDMVPVLLPEHHEKSRTVEILY